MQYYCDRSRRFTGACFINNTQKVASNEQDVMGKSAAVGDSREAGHNL